MNGRETLAAVRDLLRASIGRLSVLFFGVLGPLVVFGALAEDVWRHGGLAIDVPILLGIHRYSSRTLDLLAVLFTVLGSAPCVAVFAAGVTAIVWRHRRRRDLVFLVTSLGGAALLNLIVKAIFQRARPALWPSPAPEFDYGFPSGHAMASMALGIALVAVAWPTRWRTATVIVSVLFVAAVSGSRLYLGVHYPSDVLGAWAASIVWVTGAHAIVYGTANRLARKNESGDSRPSGSSGQDTQ